VTPKGSFASNPRSPFTALSRQELGRARHGPAWPRAPLGAGSVRCARRSSGRACVA
jgi:hypothetical protein